MKIIGADAQGRTVIVQASFDEWDLMEKISGMAPNMKSFAPGAQIDLALVVKIVSAIGRAASVREKIKSAQEIWTVLGEELDAIVANFPAPPGPVNPL